MYNTLGFGKNGIRLLALFLTFCTLLTFMTACGGADEESSADESSQLESAVEEAGSSSEENNFLEENKMNDILAKLTLREKIGQMLMFDFRKWGDTGNKPSDVYVLSDEVKGLISKYNLGNVILFAENFENIEQITKLTSDFQASVSNGIPMLIGVDQEGGRVIRMSHGCSLPGNMAIAATRDANNAYTAGKITGEELTAVGINYNCAPTLDVNNNPNNPVINVRSFSSDPELAADFGAQMIKGYQDANVATAPKHFPGHGDTNVDSHIGLPCVNSTYEDLKKFELVPFRAAIENGCELIMTAHIQYPNIETTQVISKQTGEPIYLPATLSKTFLTDILRGELGFEGIITTDSMQMQAISSHFGMHEANIMAINAGVDLLLMITSIRSLADEAKLESVIANIENAVKDGRITEERINEAVLRILKVKNKLGLFDAEETTYEEKLDNALKVVGSEEHRAAERLIAAEGVTVLNNADGLLPLDVKPGETVLLLATYANKVNGLKLAVKRLQLEGKLPQNVIFDSYIYNDKNEITADAMEKMKAADYVILLTETESNMSARNWYVSFPKSAYKYAKAEGIKLIVLSTYMPYDASLYNEADALLVCYCAKGVSKDLVENVNSQVAYGVNIPAAFEVILGGASCNGKLPIEIPQLEDDGSFDLGKVVYAFGAGIEVKAKN